MSKIPASRSVVIDHSEIEERFIRSAGPGGQNVNKLATAVQLRFDVRGSRSLPEAVRSRLEKIAGRRLTQDGVLVITAQRYRTQERNRQDARERLFALVAEASVAETPRRPTKPTYSSRLKRVATKRRRAGVKAARGRVSPEE